MVRLFSSVNSLVGYQVALLVKIFLTDLTLVFALPILLWSLLLLSDFQKVVKLLFEMRNGEGLPKNNWNKKALKDDNDFLSEQEKIESSEPSETQANQ